MEKSKLFFKEVVKGVLFSLIFCLILTLILSLITLFTDINLSNTAVISSILKEVSVIVGVFLAVKEKRNGWLKGLITGAVYSILAFLVFSLISGNFIFDKVLGYEILFCCIFGAIAGALAVNVKK